MTVQPGTKVRYHGSIEEYHGEMIVEGHHPELTNTNGEYSPIRYYLRYGTGFRDYLHNVRPESFTVLREPGLTEEEENGHA